MDDEERVLAWLLRSLNAFNYDVLLAADAATAFQMLDSCVVDALILDVGLGRRSGLDVLEHVRSTTVLAQLPVVILTGVTDFTPEEEALIRRNEAYVFYKPTAIADIAAALNRLLRCQSTLDAAT